MILIDFPCSLRSTAEQCMKYFSIRSNGKIYTEKVLMLHRRSKHFSHKIFNRNKIFAVVSTIPIASPETALPTLCCASRLGYVRASANRISKPNIRLGKACVFEFDHSDESAKFTATDGTGLYVPVVTNESTCKKNN